MEANEPTVSMIQSLVKGKKVVYITTRTPDYIRCSQEIRLLRMYASSVEILASDEKSYGRRLPEVYRKIRRFLKREHKSGSETSRSDPVVFVGFAPQLVFPFFGRRLARYSLIQDFFISFYDTLVEDRRKFRKGSLPARMLHRWDERTLRYGQLVVADTNADADYFFREFGRDRKDFRTLYLEADPTIYYVPDAVGSHPGSVPQDLRNGSRESHDAEWDAAENPGREIRGREKTAGSERPFRILYFGSNLPLQGMDVIAAAMERLLPVKAEGAGSPDSGSGLEFEIIGPVRDAQKVNRPEVSYINWLPQKELAEHIAAADLCLAGHFSGTIDKAKRTIAGKTFIYRAMGKPVILGDGPANHELFEETKGEIYYCRMGDPESLAEAILQARRDLQGEKE